jgi:hypothetical protein
MCMWATGDIEPEETPIEWRESTLEELIEDYLRLADSFDAANIFIVESNVKFGRLNHIERIILSKKPKTKEEKILYKRFLQARRKIDMMINPDKFKVAPRPAHTLPPVRPFRIEPIIAPVYKVKDDKNKKKYRSVLIISRSDTTGFTAKHLEIENQDQN